MARIRVALILSLVLAGLSSNSLTAKAEVSRVENETLRAEYVLPEGYLRLSSKEAGRVFIPAGVLREEPGSPKVIEVRDARFGVGKGLEISYEDGGSDRVMVFPKLPFVLLCRRIHNPGAEPMVKVDVKPFSAEIDLGKPASELKTFGTGGLLPVEKNPGSYSWLAVVEPTTKRGVVLGWLTCERGSGVVFSKVEAEESKEEYSPVPQEAEDKPAEPAASGRVLVDAVIEYGRFFVNSGSSEDLETLAVGFFEDARLGLEAWADAAAKANKVRLKPQPAGYCTWYSKPHGGASDERHIAELAAFSATNLGPFGFKVVQIDDGWQSGLKRKSPGSPKKDFRSHDPKGPYPGGMKATAAEIKEAGLVPGIWFMPFAGTPGDPLFDAHPEWYVRTADGAVYETPWGGASLDMTHKGAREHVRSVVSRICGDWGYRYIKIDGLWTGTATRQLYVHSGYRPDDLGEAIFDSADKTGIEAYRSGLKLVRAAAGDSVFILGCNAPQNMRSYGAAFGLVDGMRIGPDNGTAWESLLRGPTFGTRHYFLHRRVWNNDPDPVYVRESMPLHHARLICSWVALSGQMNLNSDWTPGLPPERLDILKRTMATHAGVARPVDLFERSLPRIWTVTGAGRTIVGLYNWDEKQAEFDIALKELGLDPKATYAGFDFWDEKFLLPLRDRLQVTVPGQSCTILALRRDGSHPIVVSTSRHVTQGMIELSEERWENGSKTVSGRSQLIGKDPYEVRILARGFTASDVTVEPTDLAAGVTADCESEGPFTRVRLTSPVNRKISWKVQFE